MGESTSPLTQLSDASSSNPLPQLFLRVLEASGMTVSVRGCPAVLDFHCKQSSYSTFPVSKRNHPSQIPPPTARLSTPG
jgi:hypothetical protein